MTASTTRVAFRYLQERGAAAVSDVDDALTEILLTLADQTKLKTVDEVLEHGSEGSSYVFRFDDSPRNQKYQDEDEGLSEEYGRRPNYGRGQRPEERAYNEVLAEVERVCKALKKLGLRYDLDEEDLTIKISLRDAGQVPLVQNTIDWLDNQRRDNPTKRLRLAGHGLTNAVLDQLVQMTAQNARLPHRGLRATPEVKRAAMTFVKETSKALGAFEQQYPLLTGNSVADVMADQGAYTVFSALENAGAGLQFWNVFWDPSELGKLNSFLDRALDRPRRVLRTALDQAARS
jgi:hypothetical protein